MADVPKSAQPGGASSRGPTHRALISAALVLTLGGVACWGGGSQGGTRSPASPAGPGAPTNLSAQLGTLSVVLTWSTPPGNTGVTSYVIYRNGIRVGEVPAWLRPGERYCCVPAALTLA